MRVLRRFCLRGSVLLLYAAGCDRDQPLEPSIEVAAATSGSTVLAPSNTHVVVVSPTRIDVVWQDNSTNESGFEVYGAITGLTTFNLWSTTGPAATSQSFSDPNGFIAGREYCFTVRAFTSQGRSGKIRAYSAFSDTACATTPPPPPPDAPYGTNATPKNSTTIDVTWSGTYPRDGFRIDRSLDLGATWTIVGTVGASALSISDTGRAAEQQVCYRVFAFNLGGDSPASNADCTAPPAAPTGLAATGLDGPVIDLAWTDNSALESGYEVQRSTDGVAFSAVAGVPANSATYSDAGVSENVTYWYIVRAKKDGGFSDPSNVGSARAGLLTPPAAPFFRYVDVIPWRIVLSWGVNLSNQDGFKLERCEALVCSDEYFTVMAVIAATGSTSYYFEDYGVEGGATYTYRVRAFNRAGESAPSNPISATACIVGVSEDGFYICI